MKEQADNDGKEPENKPPLQHHFPWKWVFIGIAIIIGIGVIVLGITCFAALNSSFNSRILRTCYVLATSQCFIDYSLILSKEKADESR
jgi:hypothetical protein